MKRMTVAASGPIWWARRKKFFPRWKQPTAPEDMALPLFRFHPLTGDRRGTYSVTVKANWRVTFGFRNGAAYDVNLEDYH